jgi:hypothetical protein
MVFLNKISKTKHEFDMDKTRSLSSLERIVIELK